MERDELADDRIAFMAGEVGYSRKVQAVNGVTFGKRFTTGTGVYHGDRVVGKMN